MKYLIIASHDTVISWIGTIGYSCKKNLWISHNKFEIDIETKSGSPSTVKLNIR